MQPSITLRFKLSSVFETISGKIHCLRLFLRRGVLRCAFRLDAGGMKDAIASEPPLRHGLHAVFERVGRGFHPLVDYRQGFVLLNQHELNALARRIAFGVFTIACRRFFGATRSKKRGGQKAETSAAFFRLRIRPFSQRAL